MGAIKVKFKGNSHGYAYFCDQAVEIGSKVVVESPRDGYVIVEVVETNADYIKATKHVVCVVDDENYLERKQKERRKKDILTKLDKASKEVSKLAVYESLAASSPELKALLDELKSL